MPVTTPYPPSAFSLTTMRALAQSHFDQHPIWSEFYDASERDEIKAWGVDPSQLDAELDRLHTRNDHAAYTILRPYPLPDRMRLYIKARLHTDDGFDFDGYVMNEDAFVLTIFAGGAEFTFSRNAALRDLHDKELDRLRSVLDNPTLTIFPVNYETDFLDSNGIRIAGTFVA